jgi:hypothetical protein
MSQIKDLRNMNFPRTCLTAEDSRLGPGSLLWLSSYLYIENDIYLMDGRLIRGNPNTMCAR